MSEPASATASTLWVSNGASVGGDTSCTDPGYLTISSALAAAASGDTVMVCDDGSPYTEQVQVTTSDITIQGTDGTTTGTPVIEPNMDTNTTFTTSVTTEAFNFGGQTAAPIVYVHTTGVDLGDLALNADNSQAPGQSGDDLLLGLFYDSGSSGTADGLSYTGNPSPSEHADSQSSAMFVNSGSTVTIENSNVQEFYKNGIVCNADCTISGNTVQGVGPTGPGTTGPFSSAQNGIGMWEGASGTVSGNTIEDLDYPAGPQENDTSGVSVFDSSNVAVTGDALTDVQEAIEVESTGSLNPDSVMTGDSVVNNTVNFDSTYTSGPVGTANNADGTEGIVVASYQGSNTSSVAADVEGNLLSGPNFGNTTVTPDVTDTGLQVGDLQTGNYGAVSSGDLSVTAAGNTFTDWTADSTVVGTTGGTVTADLEHNNFDSASAFGVDNLSGTSASEGSGGTADTTGITADATASYWGCSSGPASAPGNGCTVASANVDFSPILSSVELSSSGTNPTTTSAGVTVAATGDGTVNVGAYGATNPETTGFTGTTNDYFDVDLSPSSTFTAVTVTDCSLNGGDILNWWNGSGWVQVAPQNYSATPPCVVANLSSTSSPTISQLTGTVFGAGVSSSPGSGSPPPPPSSGCPSGTTSCQSGTSSTPGGSTGNVANDGVTADASGGEGTVNVGTYSSDPAGALSKGTNEYFDVSLSSGNTFTSVVITDTNLSGGDSLEWWNGTSWAPVVGDPGPTYSSGPPPSVTVTLNSTTSPTLAELTATVFGVVTIPSATQTVVSVPASATQGSTVTYSAVVSPSSGTGTPTGTVAFTTVGTTLCSVVLSGGAGSCTATNAPVGTDTVTGAYTGDSNFAASSGTATLTVSSPSPPPPPPPAKPSGYDMVGSDGGVFVFPLGQASGFFGSLPGLGIHVNNIVGMVPTFNDQGYFLVGRDGGVFAFGNAGFVNSLPGLGVSVNNIVGIEPTLDGKGYWLIGSDGGVFAIGSAGFRNSLPGIGVHVNNIVGIAATPDDGGYWVLASTGQVYNFGDATNFGGPSGVNNATAITPTPSGNGYWVVTANGAVFPFGNAVSFGSLPSSGVTPAFPVIGIVPTNDGGGYWLIGSDGGLFAYGDAAFQGSIPGLGIHVNNIVGAVPTG